MRTRTVALILCVMGAVGAGLEVQAQSAKPAQNRPGTRWALLIGVDEYAGPERCRFAGADVRGLRNQLLRSGFPQQQVLVLDDKAENPQDRPSAANIERHLESVFGRVQRDDLIVLAFCGRGVNLAGKSYLGPTGDRLTDPATLILLERVYDRLQKCPAARKVLLVDVGRRDPPAPGQKIRPPAVAAQQFAASLEHPPEGVVLLSSAAPAEVSVEEPLFGHSVFMHYLLEGMQGQADADHNGRVSLLELYIYVNRETKAYVARKFAAQQVPALKGNIADNFDLTTPAANGKDGLAIIFERAKSLVAKKNYRAAIADFDQVLKLDPKNADAVNRRGVAYSWLGENDHAIADYSEAIRLEPSNALFWSNRGIEYKKKKDLDRALSDASEAIRLNPKVASYYCNRGLVYREKGDLDKALSDYEQAVGLEPSNADYYNYRGIIHYRKRNYENAIADYSEAIRRNPKYAIFYSNRGTSYQKMQDYAAALADFDKALQLDPKYLEALQMRGQTRLVMDDYDAAIADFSAAIRLNPNSIEALEGRSNAYAKKGADALAEADRQRIRELKLQRATPAGEQL